VVPWLNHLDYIYVNEGTPVQVYRRSKLLLPSMGIPLHLLNNALKGLRKDKVPGRKVPNVFMITSTNGTKSHASNDCTVADFAKLHMPSAAPSAMGVPQLVATMPCGSHD